MGTRVVVVGGSGFAGGEVLRLLEGHPAVEVVAVSAAANAGAHAGTLHPHLRRYASLTFMPVDQAMAVPADVLITCLPSGASAAVLAGTTHPLVVDVGDDHRAAPGWIYGLTEFARPALPGATRIAAPGCYPTAVLLALVPYARAGVIAGDVVVDATSGVTGAGRGARDDLSLAVAGGDVRAYGTTEHRHVPEMRRGLETFGGLTAQLSFTPHLAPMPRGLLATVRARLDAELDDEGAMEILLDAYDNEPFVAASSEWPSTKAVAGSNRALVTARVDEAAGWLVCSAAIDNLGKGAAGQAIQDMNVALGWDETLGLTGAPVWP